MHHVIESIGALAGLDNLYFDTGDYSAAALAALAAAAAQKAASPINDMRGTVEQRIHLVGVLTKRVLRIAISRAKGE